MKATTKGLPFDNSSELQLCAVRHTFTLFPVDCPISPRCPNSPRLTVSTTQQLLPETTTTSSQTHNTTTFPPNRQHNNFSSKLQYNNFCTNPQRNNFIFHSMVDVFRSSWLRLRLYVNRVIDSVIIRKKNEHVSHSIIIVLLQQYSNSFSLSY